MSISPSSWRRVLHELVEDIVPMPIQMLCVGAFRHNLPTTRAREVLDRYWWDWSLGIFLGRFLTWLSEHCRVFCVCATWLLV